jgi:hypothetical protein
MLLLDLRGAGVSFAGYFNFHLHFIWYLIIII